MGKCRHYSLYDLRISADTEEPYILEAALFCSFSPLSVIPAMAQHAGREDLKHPNLFHSFLEREAAEKPRQQLCPAAYGGSVDAAAMAPTIDTLGGMERQSSGPTSEHSASESSDP